MDNAKFVLPAGAINLSKGPMLRLFKESLHTHANKLQEPVSFLLQVLEEGRLVGRWFKAYIKFAGPTCNPHTRQFVEDEVWYMGNLSLLPNDATGFKGENRSFVFDFKTHTGMLAKRGMMFEFTNVEEQVVAFCNPLQQTLQFDFGDFEVQVSN